MQTATLPDPQKARAYFENKIAFTTGPVELSHVVGSGEINVVDVREAEDFEKGHIPSAINLPNETWDSPKGLAKDKINVVYCYSQQCHLAAKACVVFASKGYSVMELEGGYEAWEQNEFNVETGASSSSATMRQAA